MRLIAAAMLTLLALPALAVTPQAGDIFTIHDIGDDRRIIHVDRATQIETVVSCWGDDCPTPIGSGPEPGFSIQHGLSVGPDGGLYFLAGVPGPDGAVIRVDPVTGNRSIEAEPTTGPPADFAIWPAPSFFPPSVATLGGWGLAMLVVGVVMGVQLRVRVRDGDPRTTV